MDQQPTNLNASWRSALAVVVLVFQGALIVWLILYGNGTNSLHQSALGWAYVTLLLVLGAIGIVQGAQAILPLMLQKKE